MIPLINDADAVINVPALLDKRVQKVGMNAMTRTQMMPCLQIFNLMVILFFPQRMQA